MNELQSVTDIDEVINYAEREAEGCHQMASAYHTDEGVYLQEETRFQYKAILWENIHEWLEELKELRKKQRPDGEWIEKPSYKEDRELGIDKQVVCSRCDEQNSHYVYGKDGQIEGKMFIRSKFCPNCGADMRKRGEADG